VDRNDPICELVARKVLDIAKRCVTEAAHIVSIVLKELGPQRPPQRNDSFGRAIPSFRLVSNTQREGKEVPTRLCRIAPGQESALLPT